MGKSLEEITLNTWPAQQTLLLNGWLLRYASGYTKRSNSANPLYFAADIDVYGNIQLVEKHFSDLELDTVFKITPFTEPSNLDEILEALGYISSDPSYVMMLDLGHLAEPAMDTIKIEHQLEEEWLDHFASFTRLPSKNREIARSILSGSTLKQAFATLYHGNVPVACGLAVMQHSYIGLYDIVTQEQYRRQGFGEQLLLNLLMWGKTNGATHSFIQVVQQNEPAIKLYKKLGYQITYPYWYRIKK